MKQLDPFWYEPTTEQPADGEKVSFHLKPLSMRALYRMRMALDERGLPTDECIDVTLQHILSWKNAPLEYSTAARDALFDGAPDIRWMLWLSELTGVLYSRALVPETERKN